MLHGSHLMMQAAQRYLVEAHLNHVDQVGEEGAGVVPGQPHIGVQATRNLALAVSNVSQMSN